MKNCEKLLIAMIKKFKKYIFIRILQLIVSAVLKKLKFPFLLLQNI